MSVYTTIFIGSTPIGNLTVSAIAAGLGTPVSFLFTGLPCIAAAGVATWLWRRERLSTEVGEEVDDSTQLALTATAETRLSTGVVPESPPDVSGIRSKPAATK